MLSVSFWRKVAMRTEDQPIEFRGAGFRGSTLSELLAAAERMAILCALHQCGGVRSETARRLGISRSRLYDKMKKLNIPLLPSETYRARRS